MVVGEGQGQGLPLLLGKMALGQSKWIPDPGRRAPCPGCSLLHSEPLPSLRSRVGSWVLPIPHFSLFFSCGLEQVMLLLYSSISQSVKLVEAFELCPESVLGSLFKESFPACSGQTLLEQ